MAEKVRALGRLEEMPVREVWKNEATSFTPWLAKSEKVALLGQALGIDLEVEAQEERVGVFRADILCRDLERGNLVLIENQLERTDHGHLGQLLTYAAGLKAATIVWVSPKICDEHRSALEWLNDITDEHFNFLGVEIGVLRIGRSEPAPKFSAVVRPNGWNRFIRRAAAEANGTAKTRLEYWQRFLEGLQLKDGDLKLPRPNSIWNLRFTVRGNDLWITVYAASSSARIGVFLKSRTDDFRRLYAQRASLEEVLGEQLGWNEPESDDYWTVGLSKDANPQNRDDWPGQHRWLATKLNGFLSVIVPKIRGLAERGGFEPPTPVLPV